MQTIYSWNTDVGRFWTSIAEGRLTSMIVVSIIVMLAGAAFLVWGNLNKCE